MLPGGGGPDGNSKISVEKGTVVASNIWALHRDRTLWGEDADLFKPERWEHAKPTWEYLPFSGGPRICVAQQMALFEAGYVLASFVREFARIESRDVRPWQESLKLSVRNEHGVLVGFHQS